jgi:hypothetical protein
MYYTDLRLCMILSTTDRTHKIKEGTRLLFLLRKFIKGSPDLFDKVIDVSCPIKFVNQDWESW